MLKEKSATSEILDVKTLSPQTKMRHTLEIFDLGKGTEEEKKVRKEKFIELIGKYHEAIIKAKPLQTGSGLELERRVTSSDVNKKRLHQEIMGILEKMSLSAGLNPDQRKLLEYLAGNRQEVEKMIGTYFLGHDPTNPRQYSEYQMAHRGEGWFSSHKKEEDK